MNSFIYEEKIFNNFKNIVQEVFLLKKAMSSGVFHSQFKNFYFEEFDYLMSGKSWKALQDLSSKTRVSSIFLCVLEPEPIDYFNNFGYFNWINLPVTLTEKEYWEVLNVYPKDHSADSILFNSETVVWISSTLQWAIWGERSFEIGILGSKSNLLIDWQNIDWALKRMEISFKDRTIPKEFALNFQLNYGKI